MPKILIDFDIAGVQQVMDDFEGSVAGAIRPAAQAGAQVLYNEVKANVAQIKAKTGNLNNAIYQAYDERDSKQGELAKYQVSWNTKKAPHGGLLEGGRLQRYRVSVNAKGEYFTMVRPGMKKEDKPKKSASQAVKDAYFVPLATPVQVPGYFFVRRAQDKYPQANQAARAALINALAGGFSQDSNPFEIFE